ncbi:MAG TPA: AAA family ATPase, partial [Polyangiaceae bacterium]|nr:AAA family ATPase [Polyangiaceae bacterium]
LEAIILRAMHPSARDRFQTGRDMAASIARVLLEKRELIDNTSVESILLDLLGRVPLSQSAPPVAAKQAETLAEVKKKKPATMGGDGREAENEPPARPGPRIVREVRHVAVVTLRIKGLEELERVQGRLAAKRSADSIRQTLENIAYKRGAIWSWEVPSSGLPASANAVVGLLANPARAAADAASLAIDTHEALAGASEDLPVGLQAAISIVRGIASGERDSRGHLINHSMQGSVSDIAQQLGSCTPFGTSWVSGGVYRLVRRDFRWGDAPSLDIARAAELGVPPQMRVYALERPLTREERAAEIAVMPNDLVGRDAEKADLHAAYHRALTPAVSALPPGQLSTMPPPGFDGHDRARGEVVTRAVVGEMGIGKTALVSSFLSEVPTVARTVRVECSPVKSELPLATVSDMLREITGLGLDNSIDEASNVLRGMLGAVSRGQVAPRMIGRLAELVTGKNLKTNDDDAPSYRRDLVTLGFRTVLHTLARVQPLIVVVDGVQWADRMSLDLLHDLARRTDPLPILLLLVTRPEERTSPYIE